MKSHYFFHGTDAQAKAEKFATDRAEFRPAIHQQDGRVCVVLER